MVCDGLGTSRANRVVADVEGTNRVVRDQCAEDSVHAIVPKVVVAEVYLCDGKVDLQHHPQVRRPFVTNPTVYGKISKTDINFSYF